MVESISAITLSNMGTESGNAGGVDGDGGKGQEGRCELHGGSGRVKNWL